jgi:predicted MFS family arabinose efflux permease
MKRLPHQRDFIFLLTATLLFGAASGIFASSFNNYISEVHHLDAEARGWIEFPRELPGFLMLFISAFMLSFIRETKMAAAAMVLSSAGALGLGFVSEGIFSLVAFTIIWSMGEHIIIAVEDPIGLRLAKTGAEGHRLGQIGGARNLGIIIGVGAIYFVSKALGPRYDIFFVIAAASASVAGIFYFLLNLKQGETRSRRMVFKKKYSLFYAVSALFGVRKQIFLAFGSWVLVSLHKVPVSTIALLYFSAAVIGVIIRPLLGDVIDWLGERAVLAADEVLLLFICLAYAFAGDLFSSEVAKHILYGAYILDSVLFALRIARNTYLKKIAEDPADITPTISLGITIDHFVAMTLPVLSGYIWTVLGFRYVFILAAAVAVAGFFVCLRIRVPKAHRSA